MRFFKTIILMMLFIISSVTIKTTSHAQVLSTFMLKSQDEINAIVQETTDNTGENATAKSEVAKSLKISLEAQQKLVRKHIKWLHNEKKRTAYRIENNLALTRSNGVYIYKDFQRETYYNLDMSGVVDIMRNLGFSENDFPYYVREDGCKMLGDYIMVAADLEIHPRGTVIETSLGPALVCDTGDFTATYPYGIDIATDW